MLVLGRRLGERILLEVEGHNPIVVTLVRSERDVARIGFDADRDVKITREEVATQEQLKAAGLS